jgi:predicted component of type VI protein secretion system
MNDIPRKLEIAMMPQQRKTPMLNIDSRNKNGVSISNPYGESRLRYLSSKQQGQSQRSKRRGKVDKGS